MLWGFVFFFLLSVVSASAQCVEKSQIFANSYVKNAVCSGYSHGTCPNGTDYCFFGSNGSVYYMVASLSNRTGFVCTGHRDDSTPYCSYSNDTYLECRWQECPIVDTTFTDCQERYMLGDLNDPNVAPSWYVSIVNCTGKYNTGTREITNINCTSGMQVPGRCSDYGCDKGTNLGAANCKKNPDPSKPDPGCFGRSGSTVWLMGSSGNPFSCETRDGSCQEAIDNYKSGKCKDPNEPGRPDPSSSDSPDPSSSDSPDPSSSDSPDPSSSDSPDPSSSSSGGGGGGGYDYRAVLAHMDNDLHGVNGHLDKSNILLAGINQTISNYVVPAVNRGTSAMESVKSRAEQIDNKVLETNQKLTGIRDTLHRINFNLERNLSGILDSLHNWRETPISVTVNVSSPSSPSSSDSEDVDDGYLDTLDYSDFVDDGDTSFYALGDSMHSRIMAHSSRVDSVISSMDSVLRWRDTVDADTNHNYLALDSIYNFSDTSAIKSKFSKLFFNTPAGGCFVCHLEITLFNKRYYREINFGSFAGVDICSIIRGLVRVFTCLIIIFTTVRSFIRAFSFGGD